MSNLVKQTQLKEVTLDLWTKIKERTNAAFKEVSYSEAEQKITFTKIDGNTVEVSLEDLASETGDNFFTGINGFNDLYLTSKDPYVHGADLVYSDIAGGKKRVGRREYTSHANGNGGFVKSLFVRVSNSLSIGSTTNISVWEVKKKDIHANDEPNQIIDNIEFKVKEDTRWNRYIEIPINKEYDEETYFIFEVIPSSNLAYANVQDGDDNVIYIDNADVTGSNINNSKGGRYSCICALTGGTNIRKLITNAGTVKSVNNQQPDIDGNVTVGIDHIDNLRTELNDRVSQSQIGNQANHIPQIEANGKLSTSIIPELAITRVHPVTNQQGAMDLIGSGTIQTGDVVVITNEKNAVFMYNGTTGGTFENSFIKLSIGDGTVKTVNGQIPNGSGEVELTATVDQTSTDNIVLSVGNQNNFATLECMTTQDVQEIKDLFV